MTREDCPCRRVKCKRFGDCDACIAHHREKRLPPACKREEKPKKSRRDDGNMT